MRLADDKILAEYRDPYLHTDKVVLAALRKEYLKEILIRSVIALAVLTLMVIISSDNYLNRARGDIPLVGIIVGLPVYVTYGLLTTKRGVITMRRRQLAAAHPVLHALDKTPSKFAAQLIRALWVVLGVFVVVVFVAIWLTGR